MLLAREILAGTGESDMKVNPVIIFRREFDDSGILFNPENGEIFGLNPTAALVWECLGKNMSKLEILAELSAKAQNIPETASDDFDEFITSLKERNFVSTN